MIDATVKLCSVSLSWRELGCHDSRSRNRIRIGSGSGIKLLLAGFVIPNSQTPYELLSFPVASASGVGLPISRWLSILGGLINNAPSFKISGLAGSSANLTQFESCFSIEPVKPLQTQQRSMYHSISSGESSSQRAETGLAHLLLRVKCQEPEHVRPSHH